MRHLPRALLLAALLAVVPLSGCASEGGALATLVPYPRAGDAATYRVEGAYVELSRWENGHPFPQTGLVRFAVGPSEPVLDGARAVHEAYRVAVERGSAAGLVRHADLFVSPRHQALVQAYYPLSQDQGVVSFDQRGYPWLFGASALFGEDLRQPEPFRFVVPDNLGRGADLAFAWRAAGEETLAGTDTLRFELDGPPGLSGSLWMTPGSPWPVRARLAMDDRLAPGLRVDGPTPAVLEATLVDLVRGDEAVAPRDRSARWADDEAVERVAWDGEKPPDGRPGYVAYALGDAVAHAKLLDQPLQAWLQAADEPRVYRGTYQEFPGPVEGTRVASWLVQFVDRSGAYYQVEMERLDLALAGQGAPRVNRSGPAEPPQDRNHGWFAASEAPESLVPLSEAVRVVRGVFGAQGVQIFLRSFVDPPGYSYFIDGGFERPGGRYTVVYHPGTGFLEHATGPVSPRLASATGKPS